MNSIFPFFKWANDTWVSKMINDSSWLFPAIEGIHIVALALLFGAVLVLNLRLMGVMMRGRPLPQLARELQAWTFCSLVIILITGVMLWLSEAVKTFYSTPFRIKIVLLVSAIIFHYAISSRLMRRDEHQLSPMLSKLAAVIAIALWMGVGFAGRAIGFF
jgi:hypothetical protein